MQLKNHMLEGVRFQEARWIWGEIVPEIVILHDTASPLTPFNSANYLADNEAKVSVHFVAERDGTITQQVPTNRRAGHAGKSTFNGRADCNAFAIGIEIVNPGRMTRINAAQAVGWWGGKFRIAEENIHEVTTPEHGAGLWMGYSPEQIDAVLKLLEALFAGIPTLRDITTHWYVSPGRKVDVNPLFPLEEMRAKVLGHDDPAELEAEELSIAETSRDSYVEIDAGGETLNMRRWPSFNPNIIAAIPHGTPVPVLRSGTFDGRAWLQVQYAGQGGWIVARYTAPILHLHA
jgi:N-acetylmuramoyl-L-alanine amidase